MKQNRLKDHFKWVPRDQRLDKIGLPLPPRKRDPGLPLLWFAREGEELYLVNDTKETLESVEVSSGGFESVEDVIITHTSKKKDAIYHQVEPGESVKVDTYDLILDSDAVLNASVVIQSSKLGRMSLTSPAEKGGVPECVLLWDTMEPGKDVRVEVI